ncbi:hypothetical protein LZ30DRAFT_20142 [Colletotrichum cereale]|nr:hypothetical protein LZ30DRAFT_20142 [Colletotrichum cereale]
MRLMGILKSSECQESSRSRSRESKSSGERGKKEAATLEEKYGLRGGTAVGKNRRGGGREVDRGAAKRAQVPTGGVGAQKRVDSPLRELRDHAKKFWGLCTCVTDGACRKVACGNLRALVCFRGDWGRGGCIFGDWCDVLFFFFPLGGEGQVGWDEMTTKGNGKAKKHRANWKEFEKERKRQVPLSVPLTYYFFVLYSGLHLVEVIA